MKRKQVFALLLALWLQTASLLPCLAAAPGNTVHISTPEDLIELSKNCSLDTWSQGVSVILDADLNLTGHAFEPIPTFGGTFEGNGHTISGLNLTEDGSNVGLFRYVQAGGIVRQLSVSGRVAPGGTAVNVGGIVGNNSGSLQDCSFLGTVEGDTNVGAIAGLNNTSGEAAGCSASGTVSGEICTGGIAGRNLGVLLLCENSASINTDDPPPSGSSDMTSALDQLTAPSTEEDVEGVLVSYSDTGGIAGYSSGVIQSCSNSGIVGYNHVGYNVGGIAGRQAGHMADCTNEGTIYGRKDVGGILGQAEPDIIINTDGDTLEALRQELNTLDTLVDRALDHTTASRTDLSSQLRKIGSTTDSARDNAKTLLDHISDFADENIETINTLGSSVTHALDGLDPAIDSLGTASDSLSSLADQLDTALDSLSSTGALGDDIINPARDAISALRGVGDDLDEVADDIRAASDSLKDAIVLDDEDAIRDAFDSLGNSIRRLGSSLHTARMSLQQMRDALAAMRSALHQILIMPEETPPDPTGDAPNTALPSLSGTTGAAGSQTGDSPESQTGSLLPDIQSALESQLPHIDKEEVQAALDALHTAEDALSTAADALFNAGDALESAGSSVQDINSLVEFSWDAVKDAMSAASDAMDDLGTAVSDMDGALGSLDTAMQNISPLKDALGDAVDQLSDAAGTGTDVGDALSDSFSQLRTVISTLAEEGDVSFSTLGQPIREAGNQLYSSITDLSGGLSSLRSVADSAGDTLTADLEAISSQITRIFNQLIDTMDSAQTVTDPAELFGDVSEQNIESTTMGKVESCTNTGTVEGDRNVGGIAGAVAVDYSLDPEDDTPRISFGGTYELKGILQNCVNRGPVTGKRDCVGGIAGRMDIGTTIGGQNYGKVVSTGGSYVGGIAGYADAAVRNSWAKCSLSGSEYVGGIAGWAVRMLGCSSIATILDGSEYTGSIAGGADLDTATLENNRFVDTGTAGIDGISYSGIAEPVPYETFFAEGNAPADFLAFTLTLRADDVIVDEIPFQYGQDLAALELPPVPEKDGCYGKWPAFDTSGIESDLIVDAEYIPWVTIVASLEAQGDRSLALAEGQFTEDVSLRVTESSVTPPGGAGDSPVWDVTLEGAEPVDPIPVRLLCPGKHATVWQYVDGSWEKRDATVNGSYLALTMNGTTGTFCVVSHTIHIPSWIWIIPAVLILLILLRIVFGRLKHKKARKVVSAVPEADEPAPASESAKDEAAPKV